MPYQQRYINREFSFPHIKIAAASAHKSRRAGDRERAREWEGEKGKAAQTNGKMFLANCNLLQHIDAVCLPSSPFSFCFSPYRYLHIFPLKRQLKWKCATTTTRRSKAYTIRTWIIYRASCMNVNNKRKRKKEKVSAVHDCADFSKVCEISSSSKTDPNLSQCNVQRATCEVCPLISDLPTCHTLPHRDTLSSIVPEIVGENVIKIALHKSHRRPKRNMLHTRQQLLQAEEAAARA